MCAIVDANSWPEVFSPDRPAAAEAFYRWLTGGNGSVVLGGRLRGEVSSGRRRKEQIRQLLLSGVLVSIPDERVAKEENALEASRSCRSDDAHIIALARVGGARLLYSKDRELHADFTNRRLLAHGKVYSTQRGPRLTQDHRRLLREHRCPGR